MPIEILMPALSPTMTEGNLAKWLKKEGDNVNPGDVIAEIETDKATMEVESIDEGVIGKIMISEGSKSVPVNACIALLLEEGESKDVLKDYVVEAAAAPAANEAKAEEAPKKGKAAPAPTVAPAAPAVGLTPPPAPPVYESSTQVPVPSDVVASPVAKRLAQEAGILLDGVVGTGPKGRVVEEDVKALIRNGSLGGSVVGRHPSEVTIKENDQMRSVIATRLLQSKQHVPHFYLSVDCELDALLAMRQDLNKEAEARHIDGKPAYRLSVNDFVIKAAAKALKKIPEANASWTDEAIIQYNNVDISVAVAIDGGLITPIIRSADQKALPAISLEMRDLAARARKGTLAPEEFQGGGFSISNLGMYGIKQFNAIINPPQACIMAVGAGEQRPVVKNGELVPATVMTVTLSCDHRVVDGAVGAELISAFKNYIEKPATLFV